MFVVPEIVATVFGWIGALGAVSAYALVTAKRITADSAMFQGLNLMGAALLSVSAYASGAIPSAIVNLVWVAIGAHALRTIWIAHRARVAAFIEVLPPIEAFAAAALEENESLDTLLEAVHPDVGPQEQLVRDELSMAA